MRRRSLLLILICVLPLGIGFAGIEIVINLIVANFLSSSVNVTGEISTCSWLVWITLDSVILRIEI